MKTFRYRARNKTGTEQRGKIAAPTVAEARKNLAQQDLIPLEISEETLLNQDPNELLQKLVSALSPVRLEELLIVNQQLQIAYSVGISLVEALEMIAKQEKNPTLKTALSGVAADIRKGSYLGDALARHPRVFDELYVTLVRAGETSGQLDAFLQRISSLLERTADTRAKVKSAMFYPKIVLTFMAGATLLFVYVLIPKLKVILERVGAQLPPLTQALVDISDFGLAYWYVLLGAGAGGFSGFRRLLKTPQGRAAFDQLKLKVPVLGPLLLQIELTSFCFVTELLVRSGIPITETLKIVQTTLTNSAVANEFKRAESEIQKGGSLAAGLRRGNALPEVFVNLLAMGEESGSMESVLGRISAYYKREIDYKLDNLSKLIEPILLTVIFAGVGVLALAIFLPLWKMNRTMGR